MSYYVHQSSSTKPHVCHISSAHPPFDIRIFHRQCTSLSEAGYSVSLIVPHARDEIINDIHIKSIIPSRDRLERMTATCWRAYLAACGINADVYHFHDPELIPVALALRMKGWPVIYDIHEDTPRALLSQGRDYLPLYSKRAIAFYFEKLENFAANHFTACVCATPHIAERFRKLQDRTITVNNFPSSNELYKQSHQSWNQRENTVVYLGSISIERGLREMVQAMQYTPAHLDAKFMLAGKYSPMGCKAEVEGLPGWRRVHDLGFLDREAVGSLLNKAKAGLVLYHASPNHIKAQPNKLFEYMSAGIPVIASDFPLWRELIEREKCGLVVNPLNPSEIAGAIEYIMTHNNEAEQMGRRGRDAIEKRYNWHTEFEKLSDLYMSILLKSDTLRQRDVAESG